MNLLTPPARRRWLFSALAVALLAALAVALALGQRNPDPPADRTAAAQTVAPTEAAGAADAPPEALPDPLDAPAIPLPAIASAPTILAPLPPADAPLADIFDELLDRLQRGDARAGCRLYREIRRCWKYADVAGSHQRLMAMAAKGNASAAELDIAIDLLALNESMAPGGPQSAEVCAGIELERLESHYFDTVRRTAELGDALAMVEFAEGRAFLAREYARHPERLALWHRLAPEMAERALRMGTPEAAWLIAEARSGPNGLLGELLPTDRVEAEAMRRLLQIARPRNRFSPDHELSTEETEIARLRAETLYERYFKHQPQPKTMRRWRDDLTPEIEQCEPLT
ncbi:MAG: hypothetical protein MEQ07_08545 [Aquimonas sp.]|nr:hypothetical protein [Aquimonas sp.]